MHTLEPTQKCILSFQQLRRRSPRMSMASGHDVRNSLRGVPGAAGERTGTPDSVRNSFATLSASNTQNGGSTAGLGNGTGSLGGDLQTQGQPHRTGTPPVEKEGEAFR